MVEVRQEVVLELAYAVDPKASAVVSPGQVLLVSLVREKPTRQVGACLSVAYSNRVFTNADTFAPAIKRSYILAGRSLKRPAGWLPVLENDLVLN